jgi:hypothetical protein
MPFYSPGVAGWYFPGVAVLVYEKNGLKRGPGLTDAFFSLSPPGWPNLIERVAAPGPLADPLYRVTLRVWTQADGRYDRLFLIVSARNHLDAWYPFVEADFEARLDRS